SSKAASAQENAANKQYAIAQQQLAMQREMFDKGQEGLQPFKDVGASAFYSLADLYGLPTPAGGGRPASAGGTGKSLEAFNAFRASPEYQIPYQQGIKAIEYSRAAKGGLQNPGTADALMQYGQGYAGSRLDGYIGKLLSIAGIGGNAAAAGAGQANQAAGIMGQTMQAGSQAVGAAGQAQASGIVGGANAWNSALSGTSNNLSLYSLLNPGKSMFDFSGGGVPAAAGGAGGGEVPSSGGWLQW
ncbi:MAG: hypothetical protein Q7S17_10070, partial [Xanthobacteraceae bacterium]|nr:hypothetical protein [Xanthobacteraceae bacterium]